MMLNRVGIQAAALSGSAPSVRSDGRIIVHGRIIIQGQDLEESQGQEGTKNQSLKEGEDTIFEEEMTDNDPMYGQ